VSALCLRCDWEGEASEPACPRCGAPLYRPERARPPERDGPRRRDGPRAERSEDPPQAVPADDPDDAAEPLVEPIRAPASPRAALAVVGAVFTIVVLLLGRGAETTDPNTRPRSPSPSFAMPNGILAYAAPAGGGASRLWLWDLTEGVARRGPLIPRPLELNTIASPGYGWIGITTAAPGGGERAAALDALGPRARAQQLGSADLVTWTRGGASVVLVDQGAVRGRCERNVRVTVVHLDVEGSEVVLNRPLCGDVAAVGRTTLGHFAGLVGPDGADIVGLGYQDAGVLLEDHRLLGISPGGEMLVSSTASGGSALVYQQFQGRPVPYVAGDVPFGIDRVLAYGPGSTEALVVGHAADERGVWSVSLRPDERPVIEPARLATGGASAWGAYASDGTPFVLLGGQLSIVRDGALVPLDLPPGAPTPRGPIVWILREPLTEL
jgi:hypothetical protein